MITFPRSPKGFHMPWILYLFSQTRRSCRCKSKGPTLSIVSEPVPCLC